MISTHFSSIIIIIVRERERLIIIWSSLCWELPLAERSERVAGRSWRGGGSLAINSGRTGGSPFSETAGTLVAGQVCGGAAFLTTRLNVPQGICALQKSPALRTAQNKLSPVKPGWTDRLKILCERQILYQGAVELIPSLLPVSYRSVQISFQNNWRKKFAFYHFCETT